jgi:hypothetical protein
MARRWRAWQVASVAIPLALISGVAYAAGDHNEE